MAGQLILRKDEFFASPSQAVAVADRYPQMSSPSIPTSSANWYWYGGEMACMSLTIAHGALPVATCFIFAPKTNTPTPR